MSNMIRDGLAWLAAQQNEFASEAVVYSRGAAFVALQAPVSATPFRQVDGAGRSTMTWSEADFAILVAELVLNGVAATPARGDKITWRGGTYEVNAPGGEKAYREIDLGLRFLVHTKKVG